MYQYKIFTDEGLIVVRFSGTVRLKEILNYFAEIATDEQYDPRMHGVVDLRGSILDISVDDVHHLAELGAANTKARWAVLVNDPHTTAFSMLYKEDIDKSHPLGLFSIEEKASTYLEIDVSPFLNKIV